VTPEPEQDGTDRELADRLSGRRPIPAPDFRGALRRRLVAEDPGYGPRPEGLRARVSLWLAAGLVLLLIGYLQAVGAL
jgi:hypothetical protein